MLYANPGQYQKLFTHSCDSCIYNLELLTVHPSNPDVNFGSVCVVQSWHCSYLSFDIPRGQWILTFTPLALIESPVHHLGLCQLFLFLLSSCGIPWLWANRVSGKGLLTITLHLSIFCVSGMRASSFLSHVALRVCQVFQIIWTLRLPSLLKQWNKHFLLILLLNITDWGIFVLYSSVIVLAIEPLEISNLE